MRPCATTLDAEMTAEEHEFLLRLLGSENLPGTHLEIGTAAGGTLCAMMNSFGANQRPQFVVVDRMNYFPDQLQAVRRNLERHTLDPSQVDFRVCTSNEAFSEAQASRERFDFILIDGSHKVLAAMADLRWTRLLNVGGIVCLHDVSPQHLGVLLSVKRFLASHSHYERIGLVGSLLALRKLDTGRGPEITLLDRIYSMMLYLPLQVERKIAKWEKKHKSKVNGTLNSNRRRVAAP